MRLFSYTIPFDAGSAPNPYWNLCTLTICKPVIRRVAEIGDWLVGLRSDSVVYAMKVTDKRSLADHDKFCRSNLVGKIPLWSSKDYRRKVGDCIYDYSNGGNPVLRESVHDHGNIPTDLGGRFSLMSEDFYYFGKDAIPLPCELLPIVHKRGHRSNANAPYLDSFISWIRGHEHAHNQVIADPHMKEQMVDQSCHSSCSQQDRIAAEEDERQFQCERA
ncbi:MULTISPECIES: hypothetical protein [unclassified Microbulbifer]|uniref:Nmad2 family putative nucleotide modification protein n=1 Tax=unclassified Microbulbifer TaxID=2619833 RepID=UPI0027E45941|nr:MULTISPECIES: hypothetical protein [unclassified Microbulbifer]